MSEAIVYERALTFQAAISCGRHGYPVRVNSVSPRYIWTPAIEAQLLTELGDRESARRLVASRNPLGGLPSLMTSPGRWSISPRTRREW